jgi:hypothetical protein
MLDFAHLTYEDFERLCYDILIKRGFIDVHPVGKSNASDGGKDILASEEYRTITGIETRKWIWQCKHSKKSLNRKDVSEIMIFFKRITLPLMVYFAQVRSPQT